MLGDVHEGLEIPSEVVDLAIVRGRYEFYHYNVDGIDDRVGGQYYPYHYNFQRSGAPRNLLQYKCPQIHDSTRSNIIWK